MKTETALLIILLHFIGDFLCQNDSMAINKSKSVYWLSIHVLIYSFALFAGTFLLLDFRDFDALISFALINFVLHWITDFFTSRLTSYLYMKAENNPKEVFLFNSWRHWFFSAIGADQVIHYLCLILTYQYLILK